MLLTDGCGVKCPSSSDRVPALLVRRRGLAISALCFLRASLLALCGSLLRSWVAKVPGLRMLLMHWKFPEAAVLGTPHVSEKWTDLVAVLANLTLEAASLAMRGSQPMSAAHVRLGFLLDLLLFLEVLAVRRR